MLIAFMCLVLLLPAAAANPLALPALLMPAALYSFSGESEVYEASSFEASDLQSFAIPVLLESSDADIRDMVSGGIGSMLRSVAGLAGSLLPMEHMEPVYGDGSVEITGFLSPSSLSGGVEVSYGDLSILFSTAGDDELFTFSGTVIGTLSLAGPSLLYSEAAAKGMEMNGSPVDGSFGFGIDFDRERAERCLREAGSDLRSARCQAALIMLEAARSSGIDLDGIEEAAGYDPDTADAEDMIQLFSALGLDNALDFIAFLFAGDAAGMDGSVLISVLDPYIVIDGTERTEVDAARLAKVIELLDDSF